MKTSDIRTLFLDYFEGRGHEIVPSSSLVPDDDPTLLFTNAGMVQFKEVFLGRENRECARAVTDQRCVRAGGKHNDLENVGYTARHHTFFEMLGNFSFGDYFKRDAIGYAWELLTDGFGLPADRLWVTVYEEDDEAAGIWLDEIGISRNRFSRIGAQDNFWAMGDTGPCGPCSEIFYDHGSAVSGGPPGSPESEGDRYVEIWNLVFMQFNRDNNGTDILLPRPSVDTGLGLERLAAVLQGVHSNYETDLFVSLIAAAANAVETDKIDDHSLKVIADHIRSTAFLIVDGVIPSNEGRGYVLRRIIRRAIRHGYRLGQKDPFLHRLVAPLAAEMGMAYPEISNKLHHVETVLQAEGERFLDTLEQGLRILDNEISNLVGNVIPGETVFRLYDTYGFPADLTADVAREQGLTLDLASFDHAMKEQRERARAASQFQSADVLEVSVKSPTEFLGYTTTTAPGQVLSLFRESKEVDSLSMGDAGSIILDRTPFYAESGGQVGDGGLIETQDASFRVTSVQYLGQKVIVHTGVMERGNVCLAGNVTASVDRETRNATMGNHSATHLLGAVLQEVIGKHVEQKGSLVEQDRLRFDFSHGEAINPDTLDVIERRVNEEIRNNHEVVTREMHFNEAKAEGAIAVFNEKYDDTVRVVGMGSYSLELCGGTHVQRTGDIGAFRLVSESGISAGVRRIEAITGESARKYTSENSSLLDRVANIMRTSVIEIESKAKQIQIRIRELDREVKRLHEQIAIGTDTSISPEVKDVGGVSVIVLRKDDVEVGVLRALLDKLRDRLGTGIVVIGGIREGKVTLLAGVTKSLTHTYSAGQLISYLAPLVGGRGGGKPEMAQGGGSDTEGIDNALTAVTGWVSNQQE
ncbi:MAG: alanine--tRNA ligase [Acidiferrobacteraceae bacterium]|nr:alanine--tRNA ligase [Acidiferrobacteraceae bacterium]